LRINLLLVLPLTVTVPQKAKNSRKDDSVAVGGTFSTWKENGKREGARKSERAREEERE
jgi:hypothetical protein